MTSIQPNADAAPPRPPIRRLRWWIAGLLFASTIINYIDRQTLSVLAPILLVQYHWTNTDFATILIAFRVAYTLMQGGGGRLIDRLGARRGLSLTVTFYSCVASLTALAQGLVSFRIFRFLLGAGEGPNWPGATKVASEWFPDKERAWAVAMFDSGSSIGGAIAPFLALYAYKADGQLAAGISGDGQPGLSLDSGLALALSPSGKASAPGARGVGIHPAGPRAGGSGCAPRRNYLAQAAALSANLGNHLRPLSA